MINIAVLAAIFVLPLLFPPISYSAMCGLAVESMVYERNRDMHLLKMTKSIEESTFETTESVNDQEFSAELEEQSLEESSQSETYQTEATFFQQKSEAEETQALEDEDAGDTLAEKASEESLEATEWTAKAAEEEGIYEMEIEEGDAEAAEAALEEGESEANGIASAFCNFIPFMNLICDAVGATIEVGLKASEAASAAASVAAYAAAAHAKSEENIDIASAAKDEALAGADSASAISFQSLAAQESEQAEADKVEYEKDEAKAKEKMAQSDADEEKSVEKEAQAKLEEEEAGEAWERAMNYGVQALSDALLSMLSSIPVFFFFASKVAHHAVVPIISTAYNHIQSHGITTGVTNIWYLVQKRVIRLILHGLLFFWTTCLQDKVNHTWSAWNQYNMTTKGGIIILFSILAGFFHVLVYIYLEFRSELQVFFSFLYDREDTNSLSLSSVSDERSNCYHGNLMKRIGFRSLSISCFYIPLLIMEVLILLVGFGAGSNNLMQQIVYLSNWYIFCGSMLLIICVVEWHEYCVSRENKMGHTVNASASSTNSSIHESVEMIHGDEEKAVVITFSKHKSISSLEKVSGEQTRLLDIQKNSYTKDKDDSFHSIRLDDSQQSEDYSLLSARQIKQHALMLELPFAILLLTIVMTVFHRHLTTIWTALKPAFQYFVGKFIARIGTPIIAYGILCLGGLVCLCVIIFWTKTVNGRHNQRTSASSEDIFS